MVESKSAAYAWAEKFSCGRYEERVSELRMIRYVKKASTPW